MVIFQFYIEILMMLVYVAEVHVSHGNDHQSFGFEDKTEVKSCASYLIRHALSLTQLSP